MLQCSRPCQPRHIDSIPELSIVSPELSRTTYLQFDVGDSSINFRETFYILMYLAPSFIDSFILFFPKASFILKE